jgi:hypothetical protein
LQNELFLGHGRTVAFPKRTEEGEDQVADNVATRSGWVTFAGVMAVIAGGYNLLSGIAALSDDDTIASQAKDVLRRVPGITVVRLVGR